jgi:hypothetical protein
MATYLQGVEDYIPQFQPFDPDLNFYANVLQTKQTQYDSNWKAINKVYGQYFYSDLTKDNNIAKKDELIKAIDFNLKRVSGLDLSLEQNVEQALQVFKPFYEDKFLMKDMAFTKNYMNKRSNAMGLKSSKDEKDREMYWDTGVKAMDYRREEFKNTSDEESLAFQNVEYTPYKNVSKLYLDLFKQSGIKAETPSWSEDGKYKIITRNGEQIIEPLTYLFKSYASNDAQLQDIYRTQAYVNRKDYIYQNASKFEGDLAASERAYLSEQYGTIQSYINRNKAESSQEKAVNDNNISQATKALQNGNGTMFTADYLKRLNEASQSIDATDEYNSQLEESVSDGSSTLTTKSYTNLDEDLNLLRLKVDAGTAAMLMNQDITEAAYNYSFVDYKVTTEADPYALENYRQKNREALLKSKQKADEKNLAVEYGLKNGTYIVDNVTGDIVKNPKYDKTLLTQDISASGGTVEAFNAQEYNEMLLAEAGEDYGVNWIKGMAGILGNGLSNQNVTKSNLAAILAYGTLNYGNLSTDIGLSASISGYDPATGKDQLTPIQRLTQKLGSNFFDRASRVMFNPDTELKEMVNNPGKILQSRSYSDLEKMKVGVNRYMVNRANLGDETAIRYFGLKGLDTPEVQMNINFERYLLNKRAYEEVTDKNKEVFKQTFSGSDAGKYADIFWNNGEVLDEETFIKRARAEMTQGQFSLSLKPVGGSPGFMQNILESAFPNIVDVQQAYTLSPQQQSRLNTLLKNAREADNYDPKSINAKKRNDYLIKRFYVEEFNLDPVTGERKSVQQQSDDLSGLYKQYKDRLVNLTASNKLLSLSNTLNDVKFEGGKFSIASTQNSGRYINLNAAGTVGYNAFVQFAMSDMKKMPSSSYEFSFDGNNTTGFDGDEFEDADTRRKVGMQVISIYNGLLNSGKAVEDPLLYQSQIAKEDRNKGAMIFFPKMDVLKEYVSTSKKPGMLTQEQANRMVQNGIVIAAPRSTWGNDLFRDNKTGGLEGLLNITENGKTAIEYDDPFGGGFKIIKDKSRSSGYAITKTVKTINDYTGELKTEIRTLPEVNFGKNLDMTYLMLRNQVAALGGKNLLDYNEALDKMNEQQGIQAEKSKQPLTLKR